MRREPQREDDPLTGGLPAHLPVVEAVQPLLSVAVLETEREPLRSVVPREMERRERILRTPRRIPPPLVAGQRMKRRSARVARYLAEMGKRGYIAVDELCAVTGKSRKKIESDLDYMVEKGLLGAGAYLDSGRGIFFRSADAFADYANATAKKEAVTPKAATEGYAGALRSANDRIADPVLSEKIDHLETVAGKIFREVEEHPEKQQQAATFLNYYLPTTLKLLDSYAKFEEAGIEGENLSRAQERIEETMDALIKGFDKQLDDLYRNEAMDIDSDIRVMENMLRRDTASVEDDFGLGGVDHVLAQNKNVNIFVFDTEVYSNTGGQASKASNIGQVAQFAAAGKETKSKSLAEIAMSYGYVYVAQVAMGANAAQTLKAIQEAEAYHGPSLIIGYAPCEMHSIKGGMQNCQKEMKKAVECGYWNLFRFNPAAEKKFALDSKAPAGGYQEFLMNEARYSRLTREFPERATVLFAKNEENAKERYEHLLKLVDMYDK